MRDGADAATGAEAEEPLYVCLHGARYGLELGAADVAAPAEVVAPLLRELSREVAGARQRDDWLRELQPLALLKWVAAEFSSGYAQRGDRKRAAFWAVNKGVIAQLLARIEGEEPGGSSDGVIDAPMSLNVQLDLPIRGGDMGPEYDI